MHTHLEKVLWHFWEPFRKQPQIRSYTLETLPLRPAQPATTKMYNRLNRKICLRPGLCVEVSVSCVLPRGTLVYFTFTKCVNNKLPDQNDCDETVIEKKHYVQGRPGFTLQRDWTRQNTIEILSCRCEQGLNLRGETPLDFESNALTTRPSQLCMVQSWDWN